MTLFVPTFRLVGTLFQTEGADISFFRDMLKFLFNLVAPVLLVFAGAGLAGWGMSNGWSMLAWTGIIILAAGLVWGLAILALSGGLTD